jgi:hypothetical protein
VQQLVEVHSPELRTSCARTQRQRSERAHGRELILDARMRRPPTPRGGAIWQFQNLSKLSTHIKLSSGIGKRVHTTPTMAWDHMPAAYRAIASAFYRPFYVEEWHSASKNRGVRPRLHGRHAILHERMPFYTSRTCPWRSLYGCQGHPCLPRATTRLPPRTLSLVML